MVKKWKQEWGENVNYTSFWNSSINSSRGVAILLKIATGYQVRDTIFDDYGRILVLQLWTEGIGIQVGYIYVPERHHNRV